MKPVWNGAKDDSIKNSAVRDFSGHPSSLGSPGFLSIFHFFHGELKKNLSWTLCVKSASLSRVWMCMDGCLCVCVCGCGCISGSKCVSDGLGICMLEFVLVSVGAVTLRSGHWDFPSS